MSSSGTYNFALSNADIIIEAFDNCGVRPTAITRDQMQSAIRSLNLELRKWSSLGVNLWAVKDFTIQLIAGQAVYTAGTGPSNIPSETVTILDMYYSLINGGGAGINIDRIMIPMSRTIYDELSNKLQPGIPTQYWFEKLVPPQVTIYQPPLQAYPIAQLGGHLLVRLQDANLAGPETPDIDPLGFDALCSAMSLRLAHKYMPAQVDRLKALADESWTVFMETNREDAPMTILPTASYFNRGQGGGY